jgi:hypothetical protein
VDSSTPRNFFRFSLRESSAGLVRGVTENIVQAWALALRQNAITLSEGTRTLMYRGSVSAAVAGVGGRRNRILVALVVINLREIAPFARRYRNSAERGSHTS